MEIQTPTQETGREVLDSLKSRFSKTEWETILKKPTDLTRDGDLVWGLAIAGVTGKDQLLYQHFVSGKTQRVVAKKIGLTHELEIKKGSKMALRVPSETLEAIMGMYWRKEDRMPHQEIRQMLDLLDQKEKTPIPVISPEATILHFLPKGSRMEVVNGVTNQKAKLVRVYKTGRCMKYYINWSGEKHLLLLRQSRKRFLKNLMLNRFE